MNGRSVSPHCLGCNRPQEETPGTFGIHKGGMPTHICWDCIDELHAKAWIERQKHRAVADLRIEP